MKPVLSVEETLRLEDLIEKEGTSKAALMEYAGEFLASVAMKAHPHHAVVLVGFGNNGGDGWVAADILSQKGVTVNVVSPIEPNEIKSPIARHVARRTAGRDVNVVVGPSPTAGRYSRSCGYRCGCHPGHRFQRYCPCSFFHLDSDTENEMDMMVVSADVPSGLNAETGEVEGPCVQAKYTATMLAPKIGLYSGEGPEFAGDILCGELYDRLDEVIDDVEHAADIVEPADLIEYFPELPAHVNKYSRGSVLVVAGSSAYPGAAIMAAKAAARAGAGYVTVATPDPCANLIRMALPSIPVVGIPADTRRRIRCRCRFGRTQSCGKIHRPLRPWYDDCSRRYAGGYGASEKRRAPGP